VLHIRRVLIMSTKDSGSADMREELNLTASQSFKFHQYFRLRRPEKRSEENKRKLGALA